MVFTLLRRNLPSRYEALFGLFTLPVIPEIPANEKTNYGECPIHKVRLVPGIVKSTNEGWNKKYDEMEKEQFPEANVTVGRGWDGFSGDQHVLYCPKCRERRALWLASVPDLDVYRTDWANKKREEDHNKAIDGDEE